MCVSYEMISTRKATSLSHLLPVYSVRNHHCSVRAPPLLTDGEMATESCDAVNMDPDMDLLSDEELER